MSLRRSLLCLLSSALLGAPSARAQCGPDDILLAADRDNSLYENDMGALSNGAGEHLFAGNTAFRGVRRALLHFDTSGIPAGSIIGSATLWLDMSMTRAEDPEDFRLHAVTTPWGEGTSLALGEEGGGGPSTAGDATWLHGFYDTDPWIASGGDFVAAASATTTIAATGPHSWASAAMAADVQSWLDDPDGNHGWILIGNEADTLTAMRFGSRENSDPAAAPVLCVGLRDRAPVEIPTLGEYGLLVLILSLVALGLRRIH